ncbi:SPARC-like protein 1 [Lepisosteus oculatus]|uniref:SPARC-like protein 1 n=1 Tax=Lepisosteus oculatus TaxID=7918 RepID=UPI0035F51ED8
MMNLLLLCLLTLAFADPVTSKPHRTHTVSLKTPVTQNGKESWDLDKLSEGEKLPAVISLEASSQEKQDEEDTEQNASPVLLSEEAQTSQDDDLDRRRGSQDLADGLSADEPDDKGNDSVSSFQEIGSSTETEILTDMGYTEDKDDQDSREVREDDGESNIDSDDYDSQGKHRGRNQFEPRGILEEGMSESPEVNEEEGDDVESSQSKDTGSEPKNKDDSNNNLQEATDTEPEGTESSAEEQQESNASRMNGISKNEKKSHSGKTSSEHGAQERPDGGHGVLQMRENTVPKTKKRKSGKWTSVIGISPVQKRAAEEVYLQEQLSRDEDTQEADVSTCENFRCKRGKICQVNKDNDPECVCQDPSSCISSKGEFEHVCGTDNKTYDTSCQLFATKCNLDGTKKGHRLHLDYAGPCKYIAPCQANELAQFPLRMRDWLKNVLLQLYEHDMKSPGFLTPKQRTRVQKMHESERRLQADDHPIETLVRDFEKNYNMYIYPVHWQFAQMDQHPADRYLSHSELAPLRVPLVPMEHCTSRFFQECDADKDKQVSFREWCACFGIKEVDMDDKLLF